MTKPIGHSDKNSSPAIPALWRWDEADLPQMGLGSEMECRTYDVAAGVLAEFLESDVLIVSDSDYVGTNENANLTAGKATPFWEGGTISPMPAKTNKITEEGGASALGDKFLLCVYD